MLKHGILGLLNYSEMSGYEIMTTFRDSLQFFWTANVSQIYRELHSLKEKGLVQDRKVEQRGKPDKNVFTITERGKAELRDWLRREEYGKRNFGLLMKTFFAGELSAADNLERFRHLKEECEQVLARLSRMEPILDQYTPVLGDQEEKALYWKMTISFGQKYTRLLVDWCEECMDELRGITQ